MLLKQYILSKKPLKSDAKGRYLVFWLRAK